MIPVKLVMTPAMSMKKVVADQLGVDRVGMNGRSHAVYSR